MKKPLKFQLFTKIEIWMWAFIAIILVAFYIIFIEYRSTNFVIGSILIGLIVLTMIAVRCYFYYSTIKTIYTYSNSSKKEKAKYDAQVGSSKSITAVLILIGSLILFYAFSENLIFYKIFGGLMILSGISRIVYRPKN